MSSREAVNTNFQVIGLTRLGLKSESTAPEVDALTTWPFELLYYRYITWHVLAHYLLLTAMLERATLDTF